MKFEYKIKVAETGNYQFEFFGAANWGATILLNGMVEKAFISNAVS
jgi:hypothetical protein